MKSKQACATFYALIAATLYAISSPISKLLLEKVPSTMMASLLYFGAGIGVLIVSLWKKKSRYEPELKLARKDLPYTAGMVVLDIAAPILLMLGLSLTTASNVSLLNNFEIVATAVIARIVFKETISRRLWFAIGIITIASIILSVKDMSSISLSFGSLFVLAACICWGFENNCTRMLASKNPMQIVVVKGFGSGFGSLVIALLLGETVTNLLYIVMVLILGFVSYGLSILFYIYAQRYLGAAKTSAYYALSPFIGVAVSLLVFQELPSVSFLVALIIMIVGAYFAASSEKGSENFLL